MIIQELFVILHPYSLEYMTYCSIISQTPHEKEQTFIIGTATQTGAASPYLKVACGELRDVWRMPAPLAFKTILNNEIMKKVIIVMLCFVSMVANAQKDVTKFLGIPIDGMKPAMMQKLKAKGFQYSHQLDCLTGEFNGHDVVLSVVTNNNKVWRIVIQDAITQDEAGIKIRFNKLVRQFLNNKKYVPATFSDQMLSDSEDISYEILVHKKRYQAAFYQLPAKIDTLEMQAALRIKLLEKYSEEQLENPTEEQQADIKYEAAMYMLDLYSKRSVWFMIDEQYGRYRILMYYDNEFNHSDGEDL